MKIPAADPRSLAEILEKVKAYLSDSHGSKYSSLEPSQIITSLETNISSLRHDGTYYRKNLRMLFAPIGDIQETAIENGWIQEFIVLSLRFEKETEEPQ